MSVIDKVLTFILIMGFLVFFHELGHFLIAKLFGVPVYEFAFGLPFGKKIRLFRHGGTDYTLRPLIPLGGFVAFADPEADPDTQAAQMARYHDKPVWQRFLVILAGPVASLLLGWWILSGLSFRYGIEAGNPVLGEVVAGKPAAVAGLKAGDEVLSLDGTPVTQQEFVGRILLSPGRPITLTVRRKDAPAPLTFSLKPAEEFEGKTRIGRIGVQVGGSVRRPVNGLGEALTDGWRQTGEYLENLKRIAGSFRSVRENVGGPVGIASAVSKASEFGLPAKLQLAANLSLGLFVFNCFIPIPALDCGQMVLLLVEAVRRKRLSEETQGRVMIGSWAFLLAFLLFATFNDITRLLPGGAKKPSVVKELEPTPGESPQPR